MKKNNFWFSQLECEDDFRLSRGEEPKGKALKELNNMAKEIGELLGQTGEITDYPFYRSYCTLENGKVVQYTEMASAGNDLPLADYPDKVFLGTGTFLRIEPVGDC